ncbi:MAG: NAD(P)-dependent glycerol-3-phosphate dehydrogenase [Alphaproteobacteria bacterium]|nr:NAD(P)-dependent glycerol-3-phosphate dehydrogenase [Alphaproteobacteria bacterium]
MVKKIGIIGTGIWGTALAITAERADNEVLCWARDENVVKDININHKNAKYLDDVVLSNKIRATVNLEEVFEFADVVLLTVSAQHTRELLQKIKPYVKSNTILVLCAKGIEEKSGKMLSEIADEELPQVEFAILSGPGFARDVADKKFVSVTIGAKKEDVAKKVTEMMGTPYFRPYMTTDIISVQIGGSVKNVIAIASGIVEGAEFGDGARAALITRGFHEMAKLTEKLGGKLVTLKGMCGLGDLVMTASCYQSRNFSFGVEVGKCGNAKEVMEKNTKTVEGIFTTKAVVKRARDMGIEMPISEVMEKLLFDGVSLNDAMAELLSRSYKVEGS